MRFDSHGNPTTATTRRSWFDDWGLVLAGLMLFCGIALLTIFYVDSTRPLTPQPDQESAILPTVVVLLERIAATPTPRGRDCQVGLEVGKACIWNDSPTPLPNCPTIPDRLCIYTGPDDFIPTPNPTFSTSALYPQQGDDPGH